MKSPHQIRPSGLPIDDVLDALLAALRVSVNGVLVAPPGAGKTTIVPLALLSQEWLGGQKILVLEPRRLAARAAAQRMATLLGEQVGETVGVRARMETRVGAETRIEVVTEGVFTRMIVDDPGLEGVGAVVFDEFHERSLDSDLGLALALDAQAGLREDLRMLVMSATIDGARVADILGKAPAIKSDGRSFPVETVYLGRRQEERIEAAVAFAVRTALSEHAGSVLAFLPGQREIQRAGELLEGSLANKKVVVAPLFGAMDGKAQNLAIAPAPGGQRKVVLATAIAETSLTIDGVNIVVDSGLARVPRYDAGARTTRLETVRASRASADQRRGRAGRLAPGVCYRLWNQPETQGLRAFEDPEILSADLTGLLLDCAAWGVADLGQLTWLDPPPRGALEAAGSMLRELGAIDLAGRITDRGKALRRLPMPPHLAAMVLDAGLRGQANDAANLAAVLIERGLGGSMVDLDDRLTAFSRDRGRRASAMRAMAGRWAKAAQEQMQSGGQQHDGTKLSTAGLAALAFPDQIAKRRGQGGRYLMTNGREARLDDASRLAASEFLVIADMQGRAAGGRILAAGALTRDKLEEIAADRIETLDQLKFDAGAAAVRATRIRRLGAIVLGSEAAKVARSEVTTRELARGIAEEIGVEKLPWSKAQLQLIARLSFLRRADPSWPDLSFDAIGRNWQDVLVPNLIGKAALSEIGAGDLSAIFDAQLNWGQRREIDQKVPTHFTAPTGNRFAISYEGERAPSVALRVQELFGLTTHPSIADGRLPLTLELLSPASRPIQVTRDLPGFWAGSWRDVKADMKGRYPKHVWPDDPANAKPTARAKARK